MIFQRRLRWNEEIEQRLTTTVVVATHAPQRQRPVSDLLNRYLGGSAMAARVESQLTAANLNLTVGEYWLIQSGCTLVGFLIGWFVSGQFLGGLLLAAFRLGIAAFHLATPAHKVSQCLCGSVARHVEPVSEFAARRLRAHARLPRDSGGDARPDGGRIFPDNARNPLGLRHQ